MNRRQWLGAGVAVAAGLAGAGWSWWRAQSADQAEAQFWTGNWQDPVGAKLDVMAWRGRPLVVNFWATWCPPCIEELPLLDRFYQTHKAQGWQVLGLAVDQSAAVQRFLARQPVAFPVAMAGLGGTELSRQWGNDTGGLPYSVLFDRSGARVEHHAGRLTEADLQRWLQRV